MSRAQNLTRKPTIRLVMRVRLGLCSLRYYCDGTPHHSRDEPTVAVAHGVTLGYW
jgi:hypothetical protein